MLKEMLPILQVLTVVAFKKQLKTKALRVIANNNPDKSAFVRDDNNNVVAAVSRNFDPAREDCEIIQIQFADADEPTWILHNKELELIVL